MGLTDNWQMAKIFNWQLTDRWKSNWQLTFVMRFYWQLTKDRIALNILKTGCKIRTVDLFCPIKVRFLLHISSTPESHISFIITAWTIHSKVVCHTHFGDIILDTQLDRQLTRWPYFKSCCKFLCNWFGNGIWALQKPHSY